MAVVGRVAVGAMGVGSVAMAVGRVGREGRVGGVREAMVQDWAVGLVGHMEQGCYRRHLWERGGRNLRG